MSVTLTDLITKVRRRAGIETSSFISASDVSVSDTEITDYINEAASYLTQHLAGTGEAWTESKTQLTCSASSNVLNLPSDYFRLVALDKMTGTDGYREVTDMTIAERNDHRGYFGYISFSFGDVPGYRLSGNTMELLPESAAPGTYHLRYIPNYTDLTSGSDTVSFPMHWHDYVTTYAAIQCLVKLMLPCDDLKEHLVRLERTIVRGASSRGQPRRMLRTRRSANRW